jgi:hypothetical protein
LLTDVNAKTGRQEDRKAGRREPKGRKKGTQRRKGARTQREEKKIERGSRKKGMRMEGDGRALVLVFPCAFAPLQLCVYFFTPFYLGPRSTDH